MGDQALSSLTNFALNILVVRTVGVSEFGAFSIAFVVYLGALGISRALATEPLLVRFSGTSDERWRQGARLATGSAVSIGLVGGAICGLVGSVAGGSTGKTFLALGVTLPGLLLQDSWRYSFFARNTPRPAFVNDLIWATALFFSVSFFLYGSRGSAAWFMLIWGSTGCVAATVGFLQTGVRPDPTSARGWYRENREIAPRYLGEFLALSGSNHLVYYGSAYVAGFAAVGALRTGQVLLGPLNVLLFGAYLVAIPQGVEALTRSADALLGTTRTLAISLASLALVWGAALYLLPASVGTAIVGTAWHPAHRLILPIAIWMSGMGVSTAALTGLRALGAAKRSLQARVATVPFLVFGGIGGAIVGGALGAAIALALARWIEAVVWWRQLGKALEERSKPARVSEDPGTSAGNRGSDPHEKQEKYDS